MPAHLAAPSAEAQRSAPLPLLVLAGLLALLACMLVVVGVPVVLAAVATVLLGGTLVLRAERVVLRDLRARVALPTERDHVRSIRLQVDALCSAAGIPEPELLVGGEGVAPATAVARSRRASSVVVSQELLSTPPADRALPLAAAVARIALGDAVVVTIASAPGAMGATLLSRLLLAAGATGREQAAQLAAASLAGAARSGSTTRPAVPYREFVKA